MTRRNPEEEDAEGHHRTSITSGGQMTKSRLPNLVHVHRLRLEGAAALEHVHLRRCVLPYTAVRRLCDIEP